MDIAVHPAGGKGRRRCPALIGWISARDCGKHRLKSIRCTPDCKYLAQHERYQHAKHADAFHQAWIQAVTPIYQAQDAAAIDFMIATEMAMYWFLSANPTTEDQELIEGLNFLHRQLSPVQVVEAVGGKAGRALAEHAQSYQKQHPKFDTEKGQSVVDLLTKLLSEHQDAEDPRHAIGGLLGHLEANFDLSSDEPQESDENDVTVPTIITPTTIEHSP